jgi:exonuclease SbcC
MTLYRGHLMPGGEGVVEEGGRKNSVLKRIAEKVGLTFEQFTRAVLLAQNDFATFLKSEDKERAEILQALTGTEHFESISRAVYQRCSEEKQKIENLRAKLQGNPPLSADERSAAEAANNAAAADRADLENRLLILKSQGSVVSSAQGTS